MQGRSSPLVLNLVSVGKFCTLIPVDYMYARGYRMQWLFRCCASLCDDTAESPSMQPLAANAPEGLVLPDFDASVIRAIQNDQVLCAAYLLQFNPQNQPFINLAALQPAYNLVQCTMDGNKQYCFLSTPGGEPGVAVGIVYAPHVNQLMVRSLSDLL